MGNFIGQIARALFGVMLLGAMVTIASICKLLQLLPLSKAYRQGCAVLVTKFFWKISMSCAPWMWFSGDKDNAENFERFLEDMAADDERSRLGQARQPSFIIGNHASFLDTVLTLVVVPPRVAWRMRTYMSSHLFSLPILSTICQTIGHYPVYFTKSEYGVFKVDQEKMAIEQGKVDQHLKGGGVLAFFPEGQMNKTPDTLCSFRYGGFKKALQFDSRIWGLTMYNNSKAWPAKEQLGGFPAVGSYRFRPVAPEGCRKLVAELRKESGVSVDDTPDDRLLAEYAQKWMQGHYDALLPKDKTA